ncbi:MAG: hypothetical protein QM803_00960 [Rhodocyclaceae bacterium]
MRIFAIVIDGRVTNRIVGTALEELPHIACDDVIDVTDLACSIGELVPDGGFPPESNQEER